MNTPLTSYKSNRAPKRQAVRRIVSVAIPALVVIAIPSAALAAGEAGHGGPVMPVLLGLIVLLIAGRFGADLALRAKQPEVLGELVAGIVLGNIGLFGLHQLDFIKHNQVIEVLSQIGVALLLFEVGLETNITEMTKVGLSSVVVAVLGVIAPMVLGVGVASYFQPEATFLEHLFVGATLCATSVGITARVLKELGKLQTTEAKIILGAAVIDDVLGLIILAIIWGLVTATNSGIPFDSMQLALICGKAFGFLFGAIYLGRLLVPIGFKIASRLNSRGILLSAALITCFTFAYLAGILGLAPIVGAFAAGLILDPLYYKDLKNREDVHHLEDLLKPLTVFFVPLFFVLMGLKVDISLFADRSVIFFAVCMTIVALIGKQVCSLGVVRIKEKVSRSIIGFGMIPRGEVGLIFASFGTTLYINGHPVVSAVTFAAVVFMVVATTVISPILLSWAYRKADAARIDTARITARIKDRNSKSDTKTKQSKS